MTLPLLSEEQLEEAAAMLFGKLLFALSCLETMLTLEYSHRSIVFLQNQGTNFAKTTQLTNFMLRGKLIVCLKQVLKIKIHIL